MVKKATMVLGVVFVLIGLLGFVNNPVLGLFAVDTWHNLIHLLSGVLALFFASKGEMQAKGFCKVFGIVYGLVAVLGLLWPNDQLLGFLTVNTADDILHVILAVVFLWLGFGGMKAAKPAAPTPPPPPPPAAEGPAM